MNRNEETRAAETSTLAASVTAALCLGFGPLLAAQAAETATVQNPSPDTNAASKNQSAQKCMSDLRAFDGQMQKDGYWLHGSGYGYGYPIYGYGDGFGEPGTSGTGDFPAASRHWQA